MGLANRKVIPLEQEFEHHLSQYVLNAMIDAASRSNVTARRLFLDAKENGVECLKPELKSGNFSEHGFEDLRTEADKQCQKILIDRLTGCLDIPVLAEESSEAYDESAHQDGARRWLIDPIDGTFCLKNGLPDFSSTVALQTKTDGKWVTDIGMISIPMHDEIYIADEQSAHLIHGERQKRLDINHMDIAATAFSGPGQSLESQFAGKRVELALFNSDRKKPWNNTFFKLCDTIPDSVQHSYSTAMMVAKIADGWLDGAIIASEALQKPWDTDAAIYIAEKAGAKVKRYELDGEPVVLVANSQSLLTALEQLLAREYQKVKSSEVAL